MVSPMMNNLEILIEFHPNRLLHSKHHVRIMLIEASYTFFRRYNQTPEKVLSIIGAYSS